MKSLIIAEKPSVARNIADATGVKTRKDGYLEGDQYIITWVFGHLLQLYDAVDYDPKMKSWRMENFPFIPDEFKYKIKMQAADKTKIDEGAKKQLETIKNLAQRDDVDKIISATDWDREGQIIADEIFKSIKPTKDIERLLLNEWTPNEVTLGLSNLKPNLQMKSLSDAGFGRQTADWLIGINLTSVATVKYRNTGHKTLLNVGRVLMPTLKIIYDRDKQIEEFKESKYYKVILDLLTSLEDSIEGIFYTIDTKTDGDRTEKFETEKEAQSIVDELINNELEIAKKQVERKSENAPFLFNLSNLQGYITSKYQGWTSEKVLKVAQDLYEKKFITYPRTASNVLDESLKDKAKRVLDAVKKGVAFEGQIKFKDTKRIFDSKKVESHSAIIPTYIIPQNLTPDEQKVYDAVKNRFLAQFLPQAISEETRLEAPVLLTNGRQGVVVIKGKVQIEPGFKLAEKIQSKDNILPVINKGDKLLVKGGKASEVVKKPPKHHTEKTLLKVMETCGKSVDANEEDSDEMMFSILSGFSIGTPATRAQTIQKLKTAGYIKANKKSLFITELGKIMVETFPVKELFDLDYTGRLEKTLSDIEKGKFEQEEFLNFIKKFVSKSVNDIKESKEFGGKVILDENAKSVGTCPECGNPVIETAKAFGCSNWRNGCKFTVWKDDKYIHSFGKEVSTQMVELLLKNGKVGFHGLVSKKGNKFSAYLSYKKGDDGRYRWELEFI